MENFKMKVTPEQSKVVQEVCFENGVKWSMDGTEVWNPEATWALFVTDTDGLFSWLHIDPVFFTSHPHAELTYDQFMAKYAPLPEYGGQIADFPPHVVRAMGIEQVKQGNKWDITVFETKPWAGLNEGGFYWSGGMSSLRFSYPNIAVNLQQNDFWRDVIQNKQFDLIPDTEEKKSSPGEHEQNHVMDTARYMARDDHNPSFPPKQDEAPAYMRPMPAPAQLNPAHLAIAFRIFGPYTDPENIAKMVNIVLDRPELFRDLEKLEKKFNRK